MSERLKVDVALERGLYRRLLDSTGAILPDAWQRAIDGRELVGLCRNCDGFMQAAEVPAQGRTKWYEAHCLSCWAEVALPARHLPGGIPLQRSSRHDEMPGGSLERRNAHLKQAADIAKAKAAAAARNDMNDD